MVGWSVVGECNKTRIENTRQEVFCIFLINLLFNETLGKPRMQRILRQQEMKENKSISVVYLFFFLFFHIVVHCIMCFLRVLNKHTRMHKQRAIFCLKTMTTYFVYKNMIVSKQ